MFRLKMFLLILTILQQLQFTNEFDFTQNDLNLNSNSTLLIIRLQDYLSTYVIARSQIN